MNIITNTADVTHNTSKRNGGIKYIVIHYTATNGADAANEMKYFSKKTTKQASSDYFVGFNGDVYQYNPDPVKRYSWAVGGKKLKNTSGGTMHGIIKNSNSVSIEMCCRNENGVWRITDETYKSTIELARIIRYVCGIPEGHTYRHYDVTGKLCPNVEGFISPDTRWREMVAAIDKNEDTQAAYTPVQTAAHRFNLAVDGSLGVKTVKALQGWLGTTQDGIISAQHRYNKKYLIACPSNWQYTATHLGSNCIRALQKYLGIQADGLCGRGTIKALQAWLGVTSDGYLGVETAKALQRFLNSL